MLTLTTPVSVPNIQKVHVDAVQLDGNTNIGLVTCTVQGGGGLVYGVFQLTVKNGTSQGLRASVSPLGYMDRIELFAVSTATGFTDLDTAYAGANANAKNRNAETALLAAGLLPAGTVA